MGSAADKKKMKDGVKKERPEGSNSRGKARTGGSDMVSDPRFASVHTDPRFQRVPRKTAKVVIDSRFSRMFTDKEFGGTKAPVDKRGRRKKQDSSGALRRYYRMEEGEEKKKGKVEEKENDSESEDEEEEIEKEQLKKPARVAAGSESSSEAESSDSDSDEEDEPEEGEDDDTTTDEEDEPGLVFEDDVPEVEVENIPVIEDGTKRLAAVNMDWKHVRAVDLFVVLRSFLPKGGTITSVAVYPSEFGLQRMKEEVHGPVGLFDDEEKGEDDDSDEEIDEEKLRAYEKSRLKYYFAVVECDSIATAEYLYSACDGVEFERSSNVLDLRFIPDSMEFKHPPRDIANEAPGSYDGIDFHTKALQHSNIPISWDEDEPQRVKTLNRKFNDDQLAEIELQEFLASDEGESDVSEEEDDAEDHSATKQGKKDKYRALIQSGDGSDDEEDDEAQEMEVTFNTDLENLSKRLLEKKDKKSETVWEEYLRKRKEKKAARKHKSKSKHSSDDESDSDDNDDDVGVQNADDFFVEDDPSTDKGDKKGSRGKTKKGKPQPENENSVSEATTAELELLLADDERADDAPKGYNMKPKKTKGKRNKQVPDESKIPTVDYDDPRFSALFNSPLYALDPTDPQFKRSAAYARQLAQKQNKGHREQSRKQHEIEVQAAPETTKEEPASNDAPQKNSKHELSSLVKSIKMKSKQLEEASKKKEKTTKSKRKNNAETGDLSTLVQSVKKKAKAR
ncbi:Pre-rRNA-processing protein esf1 [Linum perenne]